MKKELFSLALWMFFGFVLVKAIDSALSFIVNAYLHFGLWQELPLLFLSYSIPILSFFLYLLTILFSIKHLKRKSINFDFQQTKFPIVIYLIAALIAIILNPLQSKLMGLYAETTSSRETIYQVEDMLGLYGITNASTVICSWVAIIILSIYFYRVFKKTEIKTEQ